MALMYSKGTEAFIEAIGDAAAALERAAAILQERQLGAPKLEQQVNQLCHDANTIYDDLIEKGLLSWKT